MHQREMLLRAVLENPDCDTTRLVFADWLDENGEGERAAFIRWQVRNRFTHPYPRVSYRKWFQPWWKGRAVRVNRWGDEGCELLLIRKRGAHEYGAATSHYMQVNRGFVQYIRISAEDFFREAAVIFHTQPVTHVSIADSVEAHDPAAQLWRVHVPVAPLSQLPMKFRAYLGPAGTRRAVLDALSYACVSYGRQLAGLPPLPPRVAA